MTNEGLQRTTILYFLCAAISGWVRRQRTQCNENIWMGSLLVQGGRQKYKNENTRH